ncbi:transposase [Paracoccus sp. (in: a-proteobacteria)]|uniref:transposase n=1 Tax=Paracoccus sp. TaxID=267 RepID=UPI0034CD4DFB
MTATGCANVSPRLGQRSSSGRSSADPPPLDRAGYRRRNRIERFFSKLKHYRAVATRCEKHDANFLALVKLAATRIWLRACESVS